MKGPGRLRRAISAIGRGLGLVILASSALVGGILLHLDTAPARRITARVVNDTLATLFEGRIVIDSIDHLGLDGARISSAVVFDPAGTQVIRASALRAEASVPAILREALFGDGPLVVRVPLIRVEHAEVLVEPGASSTPTIADAFVQPEEPPSTPSTEPSAASRDVYVSLPRIEVGSAWVRGRLSPSLALDTDVTRLVGAVVVTPEGVAVDVSRTGLTDRGFLTKTTTGTATYHLRVKDDLARMWSAFAGQVGGLRVLARAELNDGVLDGRVDAPKASPEEIEQLVPGLQVREALAARVDVHGEIPRLDVDVRVAVGELEGEPSIEAHGGLDLTGELRGELRVSTTFVDPSFVSADFPPASVTSFATVKLDLTSAPRVVVDGSSEPFVVANERVPATDFHAVYERGEVVGRLHLAEPGAPTDTSFALDAAGGLDFEARAELVAIGAAPRAPRNIQGSASLHVAGRYAEDALDARVDGVVRELQLPGDISLGHGVVRGRVRGKFPDLDVDATVDGEDVFAQGIAFSSLKGTVKGSALRPRIDATLNDAITETRVTAKGELDVQHASARNIEGTLTRGGTVADISIGRIVTEGGFRAEGVTLRGESLGNAEGSLALEGGELVGKLRATDISLAELGKLTGFPIAVAGLASVDIDLTKTPRGRRGHVQVELVNGKILVLSGIGLHLDANFNDDAVEADGLLRLIGVNVSGDANDPCAGPIASIQLEGGRGSLRGPLFDARTFANASGSARITASEWNLACLVAPLTAAADTNLLQIDLPWSEIGGFVTLRADLARDAGQRVPSVTHAELWTKQLVVVGPLDREGHAAWETRHMDGYLGTSLDGRTGKVQAMLAIADGDRPIVLTAGTQLDLPVLLDRPQQRAASLGEAPLSGALSVPERPFTSFETWPSFVRDKLPPLAGTVAIQGTFDGTLGDPFASFRVRGQRLSLAAGKQREDRNPLGPPLDLDALVTYDGIQASLDAHISRKNEQLLALDGLLKVRLRDLWEKPSDEPLQYTADLRGKLTAVPLAPIPAFVDSDVSGTLDGSFAFTGLHENPRFVGSIDLNKLAFGESLAFRKAHASLSIEPSSPTETLADRVTAQVEIVDQQGGRFDATAFGGIKWQDGTIPDLDVSKPARLFGQAEKFRLAALTPLVAPTLSRLDGSLRGFVDIAWEHLGAGDKAELRGEVLVENGSVHIPQLGQELQGVTLHAAYVPSYDAVVVDSLTAQAQSGSLAGWLIANLEGLSFKQGAGAITVDEGSEVPITLEGVPVGRARGKLDMTATKSGQTISLEVKATTLHIDLPDSTARSVIPLEAHPDVELSHPLGRPVEPRPEGALAWDVVFRMPLDSPTVLEGNGVSLALVTEEEAPPRVVLTDSVAVSGEVRVVDGRVSVFGKNFEVDQGFVRLRPEDTGNPNVNVTAHWDAPSGYRVFVDYVGILKPVTSEKLRLRSTPPLSTNDILALVLFGREPDTNERTADDAQGAVGLASSELLNRLIGGIGPLRGLNTSFGASESGGVRTSLSYDIGDTFTAQASFEGTSSDAQTTAAQTSQASSSSGQRTEVAVDWRFYEHWLLRATLGLGDTQAGQSTSGTRSGLDLLWQYRY